MKVKKGHRLFTPFFLTKKPVYTPRIGLYAAYRPRHNKTKMIFILFVGFELFCVGFGMIFVGYVMVLCCFVKKLLKLFNIYLWFGFIKQNNNHTVYMLLIRYNKMTITQ